MAELRNGYSLNPRALWVGEVPDVWEFFKGKYVFGERFEKGNEKNLELLSPTQKYGVIPQSMYDKLSGMRAVKVKESTDLALFKTVHTGDYCISLRSFQGGFEYSRYEGVVSPAYHILFPKKNIVDGYYKYLFKETSFIAEMNSYCQSLRDGKNISYEDFGKTVIPYPPLDEQRAIADYLDERCSKIDEIIAEATASIEEYKDLKQAVIFEAVTRGLDKGVSMKDSGIDWLPCIPEHWDVRRIASIYDESKETGRDDLPILLVSIHSGISDREIDDDERDRKVIRSEDKTVYKVVHKNYLAYNMMRAWQGGFGASLVDGLVSPAYVVAKPKINVNSSYIENVLRTPNAIEHIRGLSYGVADFRLRLYWPYFKTIRVPLPPIEEQNRIVAYIQNQKMKIDTLISEKQALIEDLQAYKKSLIYEVVTGKRRVV